MKRIVSALIILLIVMAVAYVGGLATESGMDWYRSLKLPGITPPGSVIGIVWSVIYSLSAIASWLIWINRGRLPRFALLIALLVANAILNAAWSWLFFGLHQIGLAIAEMILLNLTTLAIVILCWAKLRPAALLLLPYFFWVCFATFLAASIWMLNR